MDLMSYYNHNKESWMHELIIEWKNNRWTDVCFDEYCAYKVWVYSQGEEYFTQMKMYMDSVTKEDTNIEDLQKDSWRLYLQDLGINDKPFALLLQEKINDKEINKVDNQNRGIA